MLQRCGDGHVLLERGKQRREPFRQAAQDRVRERHSAFQPGRTNELHALVHGRVLRDVREAELVCAEAQRRAHRRIELAHRSLSERLDCVVERAHALHGPECQPLRKRSLARVEAGGRCAEDAVRVRVVLEGAQDDLVGRATRCGPVYRRHGGPLRVHLTRRVVT